MVVRLTGTVNGDDVIFRRMEGDEWEATVPASLNGSYILDMTAYDEAGNTAYWARYILVVDLAALKVTLEDCPYRTVLVEPMNARMSPPQYQASVLDGPYSAITSPGQYRAMLQRGCGSCT